MLVNKAGVGAVGDVETLREADFDRVFNTNVKGLLFVTQNDVPRMVRGGRTINISSMVGDNDYPGAIASATRKTAVDSITLHLAADLCPRGINVKDAALGVPKPEFITITKN